MKQVQESKASRRLWGLGAALSVMFLVWVLVDPPPRIEGMYEGTATYYGRTTDSLRHELLRSSVRIELVQDRRHVMLAATETIGQTSVPLPVMVGELTGNVSIALSHRLSRNVFSGPDCGGAPTSDLAIAVVDGRLRITERMITPLCGEVWFSAVLDRQPEAQQ